MQLSHSQISINNKTALLFLALAVTLAVVNILLLKQNYELKALLGKYPTEAAELKPGTALRPLEGLDAEGTKLIIGYGQDNRKTLLLSFIPGCEACEKNMPYWKAIIKDLDKNAYRLVGVSLITETSLIKEFTSRYELNDLPIIATLNSDCREAYQLKSTPQTILISADGRVENVWTGIIEGEKRKQVESSLGIKLPESN